MPIEKRKKTGGRPLRPRAKILRAENREGRSLTVILREYQQEDVQGMIACIRDEYGETYFRKELYRPDYPKKESRKGNIIFLVAQTKAGEIAGMMLLKKNPKDEYICEIATQVFRKKYRGFGMAMPFFEYGMEILHGRSYFAVCSLPVMFHNTTQRLLYRIGFRATGFVLNVFDMLRITHSYKNGRNTKHSQGIQMQAVCKKAAGTIYLPQEHQSFCKKIYESLEVTFHAAAEREGEFKEMLPVSDLTYIQNEEQSSLEIHLQCIGLDLRERMEALHSKYPFKERQTANVFLNISDKNAVWAYRMLSEMGYFFAGLKPLGGQGEYMVLHNRGEIEIYFEDYVLSEEFKEISDYVKKCYEETKNNTK